MKTDRGRGMGREREALGPLLLNTAKGHRTNSHYQTLPAHTHTRTHTSHTTTCTYTHSHTYAHVHAHTQNHMHIYTLTHTHCHTHTKCNVFLKTSNMSSSI